MAAATYDSTYYTDSASASRRTSISTATSMSTPTPTSILKGLEHLPIHPFKSVAQLRTAIQAATKRLHDEKSKLQYMVFGPVKVQVWRQLCDSRKGVGSGARAGYDEETERLIVKLGAGQQHEAFTLGIAEKIKPQLERMGLSKFSLFSVGTAEFSGFRSSKQPDASFKPATRKGSKKAPSIVFESGFSESLPELRKDAAWWLTNSNEEVKIVVLIAIREKTLTVIIEKWIIGEAHLPGQKGTRSRPKPMIKMPIKDTEICIRPATEGSTTFTTTGAPLVLEFESLLDRLAVWPEGDVVFSAAELSTTAAAIWANMKEEAEEEGQAEEEG